MRLYQTPFGQWAGTQADARAISSRHGTTYQQTEVPTDKAGLLEFLNANEVGNRLIEAMELADPQPTTACEPITEDAFEALPLPMQLHLAALAVENARNCERLSRQAKQVEEAQAAD